MQNPLQNSEADTLSEEVALLNTEKALLNILDDYSAEKHHADDGQRALLNILDDYGVEKANMENTQRAVLNILDDYAVEKTNMENTQRAVLNILDDYAVEKTNMENTQRAVLNILDDYALEKTNMENTQRAVLNILDDYSVEKLNLEKTQSAVLNILDDYNEEKSKVETINNDLTSANKELEAFSYSVSHDLRAPLRALEGFANALSEKYTGKFDQDANRWLDFITTNAKRMDLLISDMLKFSRVSRDNIRNSSLNMKVLAQSCFESIKMSYPGKDITFCLENIPDSFGDVAMVRQVWQNLISNALKYSSKNENITIAITGKIENDFTVYSIKDNGAGFDEKYKDKLFGVFQRLHSNKEFEGTGVGLAIVKRIIQKHNGCITASGQLGKGAEFIFALPVHKIIENNNLNI